MFAQSTWDILIAGQQVGSELIERSPGALKGKGSFAVSQGGQTISIDASYAVELDFASRPTSYTADLAAMGQSSHMEARFAGGSVDVSVASGGRVLAAKKLAVGQDTVLLDNNIVGHFLLLSASLQPDGPAEASLKILVPQVVSLLAGSARREPGSYAWREGSLSGTAVRWEISLTGQLVQVYQDVVSSEVLRVNIPAAQVAYVRHGLEVEPLAAVAPAPAYLRGAQIKEEQVTFRSGDLELGATLTWSSAQTGRRPGVLLVSGSGPNDRDETVGGMKPFRDLAVGLAGAGFVVMRFDKRTFAYRTRLDKLGPLEKLTVYDEYVPDTVAAVRCLAGHPMVEGERIALLGHSLGAWMLPLVPAALGPDASRLRALVLMAPPGVDMGANLIRQLTYKLETAGTSPALDEIVADAERRIDLLRQGSTFQGDLLGAGASYWADMLRRRPLDAARDLGLPLLVLRGAKDYQVSAEDMADWEKALAGRADATVRTLPDLNHLFGFVSGQSTGAEYFRDAYVEQSVIDLLGSWLASAFGRL